MSVKHAFINELKNEAANTRRMLERLPADAFGYKPHEKSMALGRLATHVAELPGWITMTIHTDQLDFAAGDYKPTFANSAEELVRMHDEHVAAALAALENMPDEDMMKTWTLRDGDHIILQLPKVAVIRSMCINHMIHHRGQLSVYMRLNGVALPGIYGPTADEIPMKAAAKSAMEEAAAV